MGAMMAEIVDLLVELSPSLQVGWVLWLVSGLALGSWFWLSRGSELQHATSSKPSMSLPAPVTSVLGLFDQPAASSSAPASTSESGFRPGRSSRSLRRKG
jgi:hypothetical protein